MLAEASVSRRHALLIADPGDSTVIDLDSTNGTFVNGVQAPPDEAVRIVDGDVSYPELKPLGLSLALRPKAHPRQ